MFILVKFIDQNRKYGSKKNWAVWEEKPWDVNNHPISVFSGSADYEMSEEQKKEKLSELRKKEQDIQDILAKKTKELKKICLREAVRNQLLINLFFTD